jgi:probable rRNA maturation factor
VDPGSRRTNRAAAPQTRRPAARRTTRAALITVLITDGRGRRVRIPGLAGWLARIAPASARGDLAIAIVSDARIRALNEQFRRKDLPTDVLSFSASDPPAFAARRLRRGKRFLGDIAARRLGRGERFLGDIVIAAGVARRQAREAGHSYAAELKVLALHGLLHLLGYDHHDPADGGRMVRLERRLRAKGGLRLGLIERARAGPRPREPRSR